MSVGVERWVRLDSSRAQTWSPATAPRVGKRWVAPGNQPALIIDTSAFDQNRKTLATRWEPPVDQYGIQRSHPGCIDAGKHTGRQPNSNIDSSA